MKKNILEYLTDHWETILSMVRDCNSYDGSLEDYEYFENDEWFFRDFFTDAWKAVEMVSNGDYKSTDDYVQFDIYGLNSYNTFEVKENLINNVEEIFDRWYEMFLDNEVDYDYYENEFKEMIDQLGDE